MLKKSNLIGISASLIAVVGGLLFGFVVLIVSNPSNALNGFGALLTGAFDNGMTGIGTVLYFAATYILVGLAVGFAGKTGVFNIGGAGQFLFGGFAAVFVGLKFADALPGWILVPAAVLAGALAGGFFGLVIGLMKAYFNISEVVVGILLNYVGVYIVNILVTATIYDSLGNRSLPLDKKAMIPKMGLDAIFPNSGVDVGIFVAIILAIVLYIVLNKTVFGYEIRACGYNQFAGLYAGINAKRNINLSMAISGAMAGIAGAFLYLSASHNYLVVVDTTPAQAMTGISVSLLAMDNPIGIIFTGLFIAYITVGGFNMQVFGFVPEIVNIVIAAIIYFSAFVMLIRAVIVRFQKRNAANKTTKNLNPKKEANEA